MRLVVLSRPEFNRVLADMPSVSRGILESVGARLRAADARFRSSDQRLTTAGSRVSGW